jgi:hypothetical protein
MTHAEFVQAYRAGVLEVQIDRAAAARFMSARTMLPLVVLPILGLGVAAVLTGRIVIGVLVFSAGLAIRFAVRAAGHGFVLARALHDAALFEEVVRKKILVLRPR